MSLSKLHESIYNRLTYTIDMAWNMSFNQVILVKEIAHAISSTDMGL